MRRIRRWGRKESGESVISGGGPGRPAEKVTPECGEGGSPDCACRRTYGQKSPEVGAGLEL